MDDNYRADIKDNTADIINETAYKALAKQQIPSGIYTTLEAVKNSSCVALAENIRKSSAVNKAAEMLASNIAASVQHNVSEIVKSSVEMLASSAYQSLKLSSQMGYLLDELTNVLQINIPKITLPDIKPEVRARWHFLSVASEINFPIYFEVDTELQDRILEIDSVYPDDSEERIKQLENCVLDYYDQQILYDISSVWYDQCWIDECQKEALQEALQDYQDGRYYGTVSILMCQLGGLITGLYDFTNSQKNIPDEYGQEILSLYNIQKPNSEKAKVIKMISVQDQGILMWERVADYLINIVYSSSANMMKFNSNPGRNKICHGEQKNYGTQKHALKAILIIDCIFQLGASMVKENL